MAYQVVFQLNESASCKVEAVLGHIRHLRAELSAEGVEIELVAHSDGISALYRAPNPQARSIQELAGQGVRFAACHTAMTSRGVTDEDILEVAQIVPSGVAEIVRRQAEGWQYVRP